MPVTQGRTRKQIRVAVGYNLGSIYVSAATAQGTTTTLIDATLAGGDDVFNGDYVVLTSGSNDGTIQKTTDYVQSSGAVTVDEVVTQTESGDTYELWSEDYNPLNIHEFINSAILDATGRAFDPEVDITLHGDMFRTRYDIPATLDTLTAVQWRSRMQERQVIARGIVWDESVDGDFTIVQDTEDLLMGKISTRFTIGAAVSNGDLASESVAAVNLSRHDFIEFPIKVRDTVVAGAFALRLSATANGADTDKIVTIPALVGEVDTWVRVAMTDSFSPSATTAIISVALEMNANAGDNIVWLGEVKATNSDSHEYTTLKRKLWTVDLLNKDLYLKQTGRHLIGHNLIRLIGGDKPVLLNADATVCEIDDWYVIARATELALSSLGRQRSEQEEADRVYWRGEARRAWRSLPSTAFNRGTE